MAGNDVTPPPERLTERLQIRTAFTTRRGQVTKFLVQLEFWMNGEWWEVVRYDHDSESPGGHDVEAEGIHRDVFKPGEKHHTVEFHSGMSSNEAFQFAEDDLRENAEDYIKRFQQWHEVNEGRNP